MATKIGIGVSTNFDSFRAGKDACKTAYLQLEQSDPNILIVFISSIFDQEEAINGIRSVSEDVPLVGINSPSSITNYGSVANSITVCAIHSEDFNFSYGISDKISENTQNSSTQLAKNISYNLKGAIRQIYIMFGDSLTIDAHEALKGAQTTLGTSFPIIGGNSIDGSKFQASYQYFNEKVLTDSLIGLLIGGDIGLGIGRSNAWKPIGRPHDITKSRLNIIRELNKKIAVELYEEYIDKSAAELKIEGFATLGSIYPLGVKIGSRNEYFTRTPLKITESGSLVLTSELPSLENIHIMMTDKNSVLESTKEACLEALKNIDKTRLKFAIIFSDISRYQVLQRDSQKEVDMIKDLLGKNTPFFGCYTCGEYAPIDQEQYKGQAFFHNQCITVTVFSEQLDKK
ncbi:MAG: FIST N-terminal domain-containing protein [Candidatus Omnitrophota bacterium]